MKRIFYPLIAVAMCLGCSVSCRKGPVDPRAVRMAVDRQMASYPESRLQDLYKSFFQDRFGPGHIISDRQSSLDYILKETASADTLFGPEYEPCGWEGNYVRVNLSLVAGGTVKAERLADALMASGKEVTEADIEKWKGEWVAILSIIEKSFPDIPDLEQDKEKIARMLESGQYACHHSPAYSSTYHPHYRIVARQQLPL